MMDTVCASYPVDSRDATRISLTAVVGCTTSLSHRGKVTAACALVMADGAGASDSFWLPIVQSHRNLGRYFIGLPTCSRNRGDSLSVFRGMSRSIQLCRARYLGYC